MWSAFCCCRALARKTGISSSDEEEFDSSEAVNFNHTLPRIRLKPQKKSNRTHVFQKTPKSLPSGVHKTPHKETHSKVESNLCEPPALGTCNESQSVLNGSPNSDRPDLIDYHSLLSNSNNENLENAFTVAERSFGVTRLMDPEDVDTSQADERSIMTYVSSIYTALPKDSQVDELYSQTLAKYLDEARPLRRWLDAEYSRWHNSLEDVRNTNLSAPQQIELCTSTLRDLEFMRSTELANGSLKHKSKKRCEQLWNDVDNVSLARGGARRPPVSDSLTPTSISDGFKKLYELLNSLEELSQDKLTIAQNKVFVKNKKHLIENHKNGNSRNGNYNNGYDWNNGSTDHDSVDFSSNGRQLYSPSDTFSNGNSSEQLLSMAADDSFKSGSINNEYPHSLIMSSNGKKSIGNDSLTSDSLPSSTPARSDGSPEAFTPPMNELPLNASLARAKQAVSDESGLSEDSASSSGVVLRNDKDTIRSISEEEDREEMMQKCMQMQQKRDREEQMEKLNTIHSVVEMKFGEISTALDNVKDDETYGALQCDREALAKDIKRNTSLMHNVQKEKSKIDDLDTDVKIVLGQTKDVADDWRKEHLNLKLHQLQTSCEEIKTSTQRRLSLAEQLDERLKEFDETVNNCDSVLRKVQTKLALHDQLGEAARDHKNYDKLKALQDEVETSKRHIDGITEVSNGIISEFAATNIPLDSSALKKRAEEVHDVHENLVLELGQRLGMLQRASDSVSKFNGRIKELQRCFGEKEDDLDEMAPVARDMPTVHSQMEEIRKFISSLEPRAQAIDDAKHQAADIADRGYSNDPETLQNQLVVVEKQLNKLKSKANGRLEDVGLMEDRLRAFSEDNAIFSRDILALQTKSKSFERNAAGSLDFNVDTYHEINRDFSNLEPRVNSHLEEGRGMISSAENGVDVDNLKRETQTLAKQFTELKDEVNCKKQSLDKALENSERVKEEITEVDSKLEKLKDLVEKWTPPSTEVAVLREQSNAHALYEKMFADVESQIVYIAKRVSDDHKSTNNIESLRARVGSIGKKITTRRASIDACLPLANEFHNELLPLKKWIGEKRNSVDELVSSKQNGGQNEEDFENVIEQHTQLHEDIVANGEEKLMKLNEIGKQLSEECDNDDAETCIKEQEEAVEAEFKILVDHSNDIRAVIEQAQHGLSDFHDEHDALLEWIQDCDKVLLSEKFSHLQIYIDLLQNQIHELMELCEAINDKKADIDTFSAKVHDLMKVCNNGEEELRMKEKLETLLSAYTEISIHAREQLEVMKNAEELVKNFHKNHGNLSNWLPQAELELRDLERGEEFLHADFDVKVQCINDDINRANPLVVELRDIGGKISSLSAPGHGEAAVAEIVSRDEQRLNSLQNRLSAVQRNASDFLQRYQNSMLQMEELLSRFNARFEEQSNMIGLGVAATANADCSELRNAIHNQREIRDQVQQSIGEARKVLQDARQLLKSTHGEERFAIKETIERLEQATDETSKLVEKKLGAMEEALPFCENFFEAHQELSMFFDDTQGKVYALRGVNSSASSSLDLDALRALKDEASDLAQCVSNHRHLVEMLNKSAWALAPLLAEHEKNDVKALAKEDAATYEKLQHILNGITQDLEAHVMRCSESAEKVNEILAALERIEHKLTNENEISAHVDKLQKQLDENKRFLQQCEDKRQQCYEIRSDLGKSSVVDAKVLANLQQAERSADSLITDLTKRGVQINETMSVANEFWRDLERVNELVKRLESNVEAQEAAAFELSRIEEQQDYLKQLRRELDTTGAENRENAMNCGAELITLCAENDRPEVSASLDRMEHKRLALVQLLVNREKKLHRAMKLSVSFHETVANLKSFMDESNTKLDELCDEQLGMSNDNLDDLQAQLGKLKDFKMDCDKHSIKLNSLLHVANELTNSTSSEQATLIADTCDELRYDMNRLSEEIAGRHGELESRYLELAGFRASLSDLELWVDAHSEDLRHWSPTNADAHIIELREAEHAVLLADIEAKQNGAVDIINDIGNKIIAANHDGKGTERQVTQQLLDVFNANWENFVQLAQEKSKKLADCMDKANELHMQLADKLDWLNEVEAQLSESQPIGGLPETAQAYLNAFAYLYEALQENADEIDAVVANAEEYVYADDIEDGAVLQFQHQLKQVKSRWNAVKQKAEERKEKLDVALHDASEFYNALQNFVRWLSGAEKSLSACCLKSPSRVMDTLNTQLFEQREMITSVNSQRSSMANLEKKCTALKYYAKRQDVLLMKNMLVSVQHRWDKLMSRMAERTRALDHALHEARDFHNAHSELSEWLEAEEKNLDSTATSSILSSGAEPERLKNLLARQRELQKRLVSKQAVFDRTVRLGRMLKEKAARSDAPALQALINELKQKWKMVHTKSVERQRQLEEALLHSGQFNEALGGLIDWLEKANSELDSNTRLYGDIDTVLQLQDQQKNFDGEIQTRAGNVATVKRTGNEMLINAKNSNESCALEQRLGQLDEKWNQVLEKKAEKQKGLDKAQDIAQDFHRSADDLTEFLVRIVESVKLGSCAIPLTVEETKESYKQVDKMKNEVNALQSEYDKVLRLAQEIMNNCHPDGEKAMQQYFKVITNRWADAHDALDRYRSDLDSALKKLEAEGLQLNELDKWANHLEVKVNEANEKDFAEELDQVRDDIAQTQSWLEEMERNMPMIEKVTKPSLEPIVKPRAAGVDSAVGTPSHNSNNYASGIRKPTPVKAKIQTWRRAPVHEPYFATTRQRDLFRKTKSLHQALRTRDQRLKDQYNYITELERVRNFKFDEWRRRFVKFMDSKKMRVMDFFRRMDERSDRDSARLSRDEFIDSIMKCGFETSRMEMEPVANHFDVNKDDFIDYKEFVAALKADWESSQQSLSLSESQKIQHELTRQVQRCTCKQRYKVEHVKDNRYRFGDAQRMRLVRILRSSVMVRVGGGWQPLDEFLIKNDPCRARGRTNLELREQFLLPPGAVQSMTPFRARFGSVTPTGSSANTPSSVSQISAPSYVRGSGEKSPFGKSYDKPWRAGSKIPTISVRSGESGRGRNSAASQEYTNGSTTSRTSSYEQLNKPNKSQIKAPSKIAVPSRAQRQASFEHLSRPTVASSSRSNTTRSQSSLSSAASLSAAKNARLRVARNMQARKISSGQRSASKSSLGSVNDGDRPPWKY